MLHHILQRIGFEAFGSAAGFRSKEELIASDGAAIFVRASMRAQLEVENSVEEGEEGG